MPLLPPALHQPPALGEADSQVLPGSRPSHKASLYAAQLSPFAVVRKALRAFRWAGTSENREAGDLHRIFVFGFSAPQSCTSS